jgi:hypothetical protein
LDGEGERVGEGGERTFLIGELPKSEESGEKLLDLERLKLTGNNKNIKIKESQLSIQLH